MSTARTRPDFLKPTATIESGVKPLAPLASTSDFLSKPPISDRTSGARTSGRRHAASPSSGRAPFGRALLFFRITATIARQRVTFLVAARVLAVNRRGILTPV